MKTTIPTAALCLAMAAAATPQALLDASADMPGVPSYTILQARGAIAVDGRMAEADWQSAPTVDFIFPWDDVSHVPAQSTKARMLWDPGNLYILYECVDPYLHAEVTEHDGPVWEEDAVEIFVTPNPGNLNAYFGYEMNARGTFLDYMAFNAGRERTEDIHFDWQSEGVEIATTCEGTLNDHSDRKSVV